MTRQRFIDAMAVVEHFERDCEVLSTGIATTLASDGHRPVITFGSHLLSNYLDLLEEAMEDSSAGPESKYSTWIRWYLYDSSGDRWCTIDGRHYKVTTTSDLYDVIQAWKHRGGQPTEKIEF